MIRKNTKARANADIRAYAQEKGVYFWQIAGAIGMADSNFSRMLRYPLDDADKKTLINIIDDIAETEQP